MKKIAIIGLGNLGKTIVLNLTRNKHEVMVASRKIEEAISISKQEGINGWATAKEIKEAIKEADMIIPAIWFTAYKDFFAEYGSLLNGKIIVDVSNPIIPDENHKLKRVIDENQSAGEINASLLPKGVKIAKALGSLTAESLYTKANQIPETILYYATDDVEIKSDIEALIKNSGFKPVYIGGMNQSIEMEVGGHYHELHTV